MDVKKQVRRVKRLLHILILGVALCAVQRSVAQYYSWGASRPMKWQMVTTPSVKVLYPDTLAMVGQQTLFYINHAQRSIAEGFEHGPLRRIPFVMHPENFSTNGLVMYLPKRVEFLAIPSLDNYSTPWIKQLVAHEYRHTVQYNNLNRGVFRALSYVFGQQSSIAGLLCMPAWAMEGDAVMSETSMVTYGRGLQPSFTMGYRALGEDVGLSHNGKRRKNIDRWFCGSFRDYIPDHYELGYQISAYAYNRWGENIWNRVAQYGTRRPYLLATTRIGLQKFYQTNVNTLFRETFSELNQHWNSLPQVIERQSTLVELPQDNYTRYRYPMEIGRGRVMALKSDFDRTSRWVEVDLETGGEREIARVGSLSTRPTLKGGRVWWSEYRQSALFEERVHSKLCYMNLDKARPRTVDHLRNVLYPTACEGGLAWVEYTPDGRYTVVVADEQLRPVERYATPRFKEVHGLAWDNLTRAFYTLITDDRGMWIARIDSEGLHPLFEGAYVSLSDLSARDGWLYFGSILSGRDEAHTLDLTTGKEYRLSTSKYGSFSPAPLGEDGVVMTTYDRRGYRLTQIPRHEMVEVERRPTPINLVNPPRKMWAAVNLDTLQFTPADSAAQVEKYRPKRYRKALGALNIHSWMPVAFDPFMAVDEHKVDVNVGLTLLSQNILSNTEAFAYYGWNQDEGSMVKVGARYNGWGVRLEVDAMYGGDQQFYALVNENPSTHQLESQQMPRPETYWSVTTSATLPLLLQRGYHTRQLSLSAAWNYSNGMVARLEDVRWTEDGIANLQEVGFQKGVHKLSFGVGYADQVRMALRDIAPRWGYMLTASYALNPTNRNFSDLVSVYGQCYLPGLLPHGSLKLAANYQTSLGGYRMPTGYRPLSYRSSRLIPRGFNSSNILADHYWAVSGDYQIPVWYPEGGIPSVVYIKRVSLNVGGDVAQFRIPAVGGHADRRLWSVGGDLIIDFNVLRQPVKATSTLKLSVYRPSDGDVWVGASLGLPF